MNVACPECQSVFRVDPSRVVGGSVRARCSVCGGIIAVSEHARWGDDFPDARLDPPKRREASPERSGPAPSAPVSAPAPVTPSRVPPFTSRRATPAVAAPAVFPATALRPPTPRFVPAVPAAPASQPAPSPAPAATPASAPAAAVEAPARPAPTPARVAPQTPAIERPTSVAPAPVSPAPAQPSAPKRPINPFLSSDPNQKARRLARVLVSDMVTYHPQKREEGLRSGTLKQQFRDEIRKSYEEYVEQVGREFAEATSHFQDALNEILAGGQRLF